MFILQQMTVQMCFSSDLNLYLLIQSRMCNVIECMGCHVVARVKSSLL